MAPHASCPDPAVSGFQSHDRARPPEYLQNADLRRSPPLSPAEVPDAPSPTSPRRSPDIGNSDTARTPQRADIPRLRVPAALSLVRAAGSAHGRTVEHPR